MARAPTFSSGSATSYQRDVPGAPAYRRVRRNTLISSLNASRVWARPFSGARADWKVTSATPSTFRSAGICVSTPLVAGQRPGLASARWICRYSSRPGDAAMIPECGPFQWSIPVWRGWSVRIHSRMDEVKCFFMPTCGFADDVRMLCLLSGRPAWVSRRGTRRRRGRTSRGTGRCRHGRSRGR